MTTGGFTLVTLDLDEALNAGAAHRVTIAPGDQGLAVILRDHGAIVDFALHDAADLPAEGACAGDLVSVSAREAAICARLRRQLAPEGLHVPSLSVAICTKDRPDWLARLLSTLLPLRAAHPFEVLVVDNAPSDDATRRVVEAAEGVRYLYEPRAGLDFARNRALGAACGEVIAYLDDDVIVDPGWAEGLLRAWAENPDAGAMTGLVMPMLLETEAQVLFEKRGGFRRGFRPLRHGTTAFRDPLHPCGSGKFGAGANMSFRRLLIDGLGGFDEALDTGRPLPGGGDIDMFYRVLRAGRPLIYEPRATVFHEHRREMAVLKRQYYTWGLGLSAYLVKSMRADPEMRPALRRLVLWWFGYQAWRLAARVAGRDPTPLAMIWAEIYGGLQGLAGEYTRSERRSAAIRERCA